ncbi:LON peptidase substrate-binding domain-containing protein [Tsukamurella paurometabola]|uniref:LON peptidase substrate-binding domain-containing protein n=1 Tax=Tsukamurella paurometabola TaxID=2061 RepID=A0ABS5N7V1_TSUPA|nr:LON peptidase substrate-binding domain-containing protein [Tsukamurella paurometabola]MBS4100321.1 LON peptidase substrate-binding domain-containing protein [Tsukamurella paurometabola]
MTELPMFPLGAVLLPGEELPLRVFEPRYRRMVEQCLATDGRFGVVLIERGSEVGGGDVRTDVGTVALIDRYVRRAGGEFTLLCRGVERVRVARWLPDDPYPLAEADVWPDEVQRAVDLIPLLSKRGEAERLAARLARAEGVKPRAWPKLTLPEDPVERSYYLARALPLSDADRHRALAAAGPADRVRVLGDALDDVLATLRFRLQ